MYSCSDFWLCTPHKGVEAGFDNPLSKKCKLMWLIHSKNSSFCLAALIFSYYIEIQSDHDMSLLFVHCKNFFVCVC